ncbi:MAG: DNA-directed DNA polymerase, partial [Candidatus Nanoarchaeia archaeon]
METVRFYPVDIRYKIEGGKAVIHLFGRTVDGKTVCVIDRSVEPYFIVEPKGDIRKELEALRAEDASVVKVEEFEKKVLAETTKLYRVYTNLPKSVPKIKSLARDLSGVKDLYEYDIVFASRYLVDKKFTPLTVLEAKGNIVPHEASVPVMDAVEIKQLEESTLENPKMLAVDIETYNPDGKRIDPTKYAIIMIALYGEGYKKVITWKDVDTDADYLEVVDSESEMLERFAQCIQEYDPDMLLGYNSDGFDLPYINTRAKKYKLKLPIGKDFSEMDVMGTSSKKVSIPGIAHVDLLPFIRRIVGRSMKTDSYRLDAVAEELLGEKKIPVDIENLAKYWDAKSKELALFVEYNLKDAQLTYDLMVKLYPQMLELVKIIGQPVFEVTRMSFSALVEWFLIKRAQEYDKVIPNKPRYGESSSRMAQRAKGAFVYEPIPGLYENIAVFDFRSLYPTIIVSHNISVETVNVGSPEDGLRAPVEGENIWFTTKKKGFLSSVLKDLIERRARIKELMKKDAGNPLLAARSEGLKVMANSFYGYLGFSMARWYSFPCVRSITGWGRKYINTAMEKAKERGFKVVYGDTDSVFLQLGDNGKKEAVNFMEDVNRDLPEMMELEFEGMFPAGIFVSAKGTDVGAKKRYALMNDQGDITVKGFEIVRRNWSGIGKDIQRKVLEILLSEKDVDKAMKYVRDKVNALKAGEIDIEELVISTQLTKPIREYAAVGPHVAAAKLMEAEGKVVKAGSGIRYVIVKGEGSISDRAF